MIPNRNQCLLLLDKYKISSLKKIHLEEVTKVALYLGQKLQDKGVVINLLLIEAAGLLHDIDNNVSLELKNKHPQEAVKIINSLGFPEVAKVVAKHALHCILDPQIAPQTWEEKVIYLADKMTKYELIGVEHRFKLWYKENLSSQAVSELNQALPKVQELEDEIYRTAGITYTDIELNCKQ